MKVLLVLAIGLVCAAASSDTSEIEWIDYRLVREDPEPEPPVVECTAPGKTCKGCTDVYLCKNVTGAWESSWLETCQGKQSCNNGECSDTATPPCALAGKEFKCRSTEGVYPDPGVCTKFYYCVPEGNTYAVKKVDSTCGDKYAYNPRTTYCDIPLVNGKCGPSSVPICKTSGQTGVFKENPSMYYICEPYEQGNTVLYPFIFICPNGRTYDGNYGCKGK